MNVKGLKGERAGVGNELAHTPTDLATAAWRIACSTRENKYGASPPWAEEKEGKPRR